MCLSIYSIKSKMNTGSYIPALDSYFICLAKRLSGFKCKPLRPCISSEGNPSLGLELLRTWCYWVSEDNFPCPLFMLSTSFLSCSPRPHKVCTPLRSVAPSTTLQEVATDHTIPTGNLCGPKVFWGHWCSRRVDPKDPNSSPLQRSIPSVKKDHIWAVIQFDSWL